MAVNHEALFTMTQVHFSTYYDISIDFATEKLIFYFSIIGQCILNRSTEFRNIHYLNQLPFLHLQGLDIIYQLILFTKEQHLVHVLKIYMATIVNMTSCVHKQ